MTAVADEQGHFHVPRVRSATLLLAQNGERTLAGLARIEPDEPNVVISVQSPVNVRGRLLNWKGEPLGPWPLEYCLVVDGAFLDEYHMSQTTDVKRLLGGTTMTAPNGEFTLPGLAPGLTYRISCCPGTQVNGATQPFVTITTFTSKPTGVTQLGDVKRPRTPTLEDVFLKADSPAEQVAKTLESATESARMRDQRVLILVGSQKNPLIRAIRATLALSSPINWSPTGPTEPSPPNWAKDSALQPPLSNYSVFGLEVARPGATAAFLEKHKVILPAGDDVTLAALDLDGNVVGQISGRKLLSEKQPNVQPLISWLHAQAPKMVDAEKLLAEALQQAKAENKRIFLREDAPRTASTAPGSTAMPRSSRSFWKRTTSASRSTPAVPMPTRSSIASATTTCSATTAWATSRSPGWSSSTRRASRSSAGRARGATSAFPSRPRRRPTSPGCSAQRPSGCPTRRSPCWSQG